VQALTILGFTTAARFHLLKVYGIIEKVKLQYTDAPPVSGASSRGRCSALASDISGESLYSTFDGSAPVMAAGIEKEFRMDLQVRTI